MTQRNLVVPVPIPLFNPDFTQDTFIRCQSQNPQEKKRSVLKSKLCLASPTADEINMLSNWQLELLIPKKKVIKCVIFNITTQQLQGNMGNMFRHLTGKHSQVI